MQTNLADPLKGTPRGREADAILRSCVHCGFCAATCPTYLLLGDELDSPRGRIYLIKQALEGGAATATTQLHLDRCLTCRACETTCPSGVNYGRLLEIGREFVDQQVPRPVAQRALRSLLRTALTGAGFTPLYRLAQACRALLPPPLRGKVSRRQAAGAWPQRTHARRVVLPRGCVQPALAPSIDRAAARVLDRLGIEAVRGGGEARCCGAIRQHTGDAPGALDEARRNIDAWWPAIEAGAEAIVSTASGCGVMIKDYGRLLRGDGRYAARAARVSALTRDVSEIVRGERAAIAQRISVRPGERVAVQSPCTLEHGQQLPGILEELLHSFGAEVVAVDEAQLCCGSAGTYSVLQPLLSGQLRQRKLGHLLAHGPGTILSANVGCIAHLAAGTATPVQHWIEWLDARLGSAATPADAAGSGRRRNATEFR
jgi:glycolate oxidase iron-sulfur subunit